MTGTMKEIRSEHTATLLTNGVNAGKVLVAGGVQVNSSNPITQPDELYNPANGTWSYTTTGMVTPLLGRFRAVLLNDGRVLVAGGIVLVAGVPPRQTQTVTAEVYQTDGTWHAVGSMAQPRAGFTMMLLADGRVLILGGYDGINQRSDAEVFNPQTNTWSALGGLNHIRAGHAATLLSNGKVLVTGGGNGATNPNITGDGCYQTIEELYDPATGQSQDFTSAQEMAYGGVLHTQTVLPNGHVLIAFTSPTDSRYSAVCLRVRSHRSLTTLPRPRQNTGRRPRGTHRGAVDGRYRAPRGGSHISIR